MNWIKVEDRLPQTLMFSCESTEVVAWLLMENKAVLAFYDYDNEIWQFAERGRPVNEKYERVTHWCNLPNRP